MTVAPNGLCRHINWACIICGREGNASRSMLSLIRWQVLIGSGNEGGDMMSLGGSGLRGGSSIFGNEREALYCRKILVTLLGGEKCCGGKRKR